MAVDLLALFLPQGFATLICLQELEGHPQHLPSPLSHCHIPVERLLFPRQGQIGSRLTLSGWFPEVSIPFWKICRLRGTSRKRGFQ